MKIIQILIAVILTTFAAQCQKFDPVSYSVNEANRLDIWNYMTKENKVSFENMKFADKKTIDIFIESIYFKKRYKQMINEVRQNGATFSELKKIGEKYRIELFGSDPVIVNDLRDYPEDHLLIIPESGPQKDIFVVTTNTKEYRSMYKKSEIVNRKESLTPKALAKPCNQ